LGVIKTMAEEIPIYTLIFVSDTANYLDMSKCR